MMTDDPYLVANAMYELFVQHQVALGLADVYFGDVAMYPRTPALTIEPGRHTMEHAGAQMQMENDFTTYLLIYHSPIEDKSQSIRELMQFTNAVKQVYHASIATRLLGDPATDSNLLYDGFISVTEPGFTIRVNSLVRTARLTAFGKSKTRIPN